MKKILAFVLVLGLLFSMSVPALAVGFVQSPSNNDAPILIEEETKNEDEDCLAYLEITPYSERDTLPPEIRQKLEAAYQEILNSSSIANLSKELSDYCKQKNINDKDLAVSDLFDISYYGCIDHDDHGNFIITFKAETLNNFVALLHLSDNGWEMIESAEVVNNGTALKFKIDDFSPFAIVVDTSVGGNAPLTGYDYNIIIWSAVLAVSLIAMTAVLIVLFKRKRA